MIRVKNIYYMLAYAFQILQEDGYKSLGAEEFQNTADLLAAILAKGVSIQLKRGLYKEYTEETETLRCLRGKVNLSESIKRLGLGKQELVCTYDVFSKNSYFNRIVKTTMDMLVHADIPKRRKKELRNLLLFFVEVKPLVPHAINWKICYDRNNQSYRMLISICYLVIKGLLQKTSDGVYKMMDFLDEQRMCRLYEKFILEYYRKEHPELSAAPLQVKWAVDDGFDFMLPAMQTDITLSYDNRKLIVDAKYYAHSTQMQFEAHTIHSGNLYQIFTYVKNEAQQTPCVSGMLLYAKTDDAIHPNSIYHMSGNQISVKTLDLSGEFANIAATLDDIANHFISQSINS